MMEELQTGDFVEAAMGHDTGKCYVIFQTDAEYVYLVDGRIRTTDRPKKKKKKHVIKRRESNFELAFKVKNQTVRNEEIKRAIKLLQ